jgi:hypothetical protein
MSIPLLATKAGDIAIWLGVVLELAAVASTLPVRNVLAYE